MLKSSGNSTFADQTTLLRNAIVLIPTQNAGWRSTGYRCPISPEKKPFDSLLFDNVRYFTDFLKKISNKSETIAV